METFRNIFVLLITFISLSHFSFFSYSIRYLLFYTIFCFSFFIFHCYPSSYVLVSFRSHWRKVFRLHFLRATIFMMTTLVACFRYQSKFFHKFLALFLFFIFYFIFLKEKKKRNRWLKVIMMLTMKRNRKEKKIEKNTLIFRIYKGWKEKKWRKKNE